MNENEELNEELQESGSSPEESSGERAGGWLAQLRYNRSFTAKLLLAEPEVKEYYAAVATELLSYEKVRSRTGWSGVTFTAGRTQIARCALSGKTLNLYLAVAASGVSGARYKARYVGATRKYEKTPALLRIRSKGSAKNAVRCIAQVAEENGLIKRSPLPDPISPKAFPADSLGNLITRGLVRVVRGRTGGEENVPPVSAETPSVPSGTKERPATDIYTDTRDSARELLSRYTTYGTIRDALTSGDASVRVTEKKMLRAIDEGWVTRVEDSLFALDELIRRPSRYIAETEEILPMELTKKISGRSVVHLSQHTDYIASVDGDEITPSRLLNVFREDSILTYENKFLNTLLSRLYLFVSRRYRTALREGVDERVDCLEFSDRFYHGDVRGKLHVSLEVSEKCADGEGVKNGLFGTGLWKRVERLNRLIEEIPVITITGDESDQSIRRAYELGVSDYIGRPFDVKVVYRRVVNTIQLYSKQRRLIKRVTEQVREKEYDSRIMVGILSQIVEFQNGESGKHVIMIRQLTRRILERVVLKTDRYHLNARDIDLITNASALHDIGKIAIDKSILNKPGKLTPEEFEIVKTHTVIGADMLWNLEVYRNEPLVKYAWQICRYHHERYDGSGYPEGLKGEDIPIAAQVVSVCDVYDALVSKRVYKDMFSHEKALHIICVEEKERFNPILLECLKEMSDELIEMYIPEHTGGGAE